MPEGFFCLTRRVTNCGRLKSHTRIQKQPHFVVSCHKLDKNVTLVSVYVQLESMNMMKKKLFAPIPLTKRLEGWISVFHHLGYPSWSNEFIKGDSCCTHPNPPSRGIAARKKHILCGKYSTCKGELWSVVCSLYPVEKKKKGKKRGKTRRFFSPSLQSKNPPQTTKLHSQRIAPVLPGAAQELHLSEDEA